MSSRDGDTDDASRKTQILVKYSKFEGGEELSSSKQEENHEVDSGAVKRVAPSRAKRARKANEEVDSESSSGETAKKRRTETKSTSKEQRSRRKIKIPTRETEVMPTDQRDSGKIEGIGVSDQAQMKVVTWNVNGLRSVLKDKSILQQYVKAEKPDVLFLNEVKLNDKIKDSFVDILDGYGGHIVLSKKPGYAGVAVYWRKAAVKPTKVYGGIGNDEHDTDGRTVTLELPDLILIGTYVTNAGRGLVKLDYRVNSYDVDMRKWLIERADTPVEETEGSSTSNQKRKDVIWCGDLNVAHEEIDIWNSKGNQKSAGHTPEERASFSELVKGSEAPFVDVYRHLYPDKVEYTYWAAISPESFAQNKGWRLDYFVASKDSLTRCKDVIIRRDIRGSDHCPVVLLLQRNAVK